MTAMRTRLRLEVPQVCVDCGEKLAERTPVEVADAGAVRCLDCVDVAAARERAARWAAGSRERRRGLDDGPVPHQRGHATLHQRIGHWRDAGQHSDPDRLGHACPDATARLLDQHAADSTFPVSFLHHRSAARAAGERVDHLAVTPVGVVVLAVLRGEGRPVRVRRTSDAEHPERLLLGDADVTSAITDLERQRLAVEVAAASWTGHLPVHALACVEDGVFPVRGVVRRHPVPVTVAGHPVVGFAEALALLATDGPIGPREAGLVLAHLAAELPPA